MQNHRFVHRTFLFILLSLVLLLSAGCQQFGSRTPTAPEVSTFIGGQNGITFGFAEDQPPGAVLDGGEEEFFITLMMKNEGEHTVPVGGIVASLSGIVQSSFSIASMDVKSSFELYKRSREGDVIIPGGEELLEFGSGSFKAALPGSTSFTLRADVCYAYQTLAVSKLCLKKDVLKKEVGQVCEMNNPTVGVENSGAPLHLGDVRQSTVGSSKVRVNFQVSNVGQGQVYRPNTFSTSCVGMEAEKEQLDVKVYSPDKNFKIECSQLNNKDSGAIKLVGGKKDISCTIDTSSLPDVMVQDVLIIELDYQYREAVATALTVSSSA